jgi:hypothetical protein
MVKRFAGRALFMALIKCPECQQEISDKAAACIKCGCPVNAMATKTDTVPAQNPVGQTPVPQMPRLSISQDSEPKSTVQTYGETPYKPAFETRHYNTAFSGKRQHSTAQNRGNAIKILLIVFASLFLGFATLCLATVFIIGINTDSLEYPLTVVLPLLQAIIFWVGALLLLIAAVKGKRGYWVLKWSIVAASFIAFAILLFPVVRSINASVGGDTDSSGTITSPYSATTEEDRSEADRRADESNARTVIMAASVAALDLKPPSVPTPNDIGRQFTKNDTVHAGTYTIYFDGYIAVGCSVSGARSGGVSVGNTDNTLTTVVYIQR